MAGGWGPVTCPDPAAWGAAQTGPPREVLPVVQLVLAGLLWRGEMFRTEPSWDQTEGGVRRQGPQTRAGCIVKQSLRSHRLGPSPRAPPLRLPSQAKGPEPRKHGAQPRSRANRCTKGRCPLPALSIAGRASGSQTESLDIEASNPGSRASPKEPKAGHKLSACAPTLRAALFATTKRRSNPSAHRWVWINTCARPHTAL